MEAIILAGGLGSRLSSRIRDIPKPMAPVAGRPFLFILLDQLIRGGCERIVLSVGHLREVIINAVGISYKGIPVQYAVEETPLGTGGALRLAMSRAVEPTVLVLNGDTYVDVDYSAILSLHRSARRTMVVTVTEVQDTGRYGGVVIEDGHVAGFIEKGQTGPGWINAGVYAIDREFPWPESLESRFSFEKDWLVPNIKHLRPPAYRCHGRFLDIGVPEDLDLAQIKLRLSPENNGVR